MPHCGHIRPILPAAVFFAAAAAAIAQPPAGFESGNFEGWTLCVFDAGSKENPPCADARKYLLCPQCQVAGAKADPDTVNAPPGLCAGGKKESYGAAHVTLTSGAGTDINSDGNISVVAPGGGGYSVRLGNQEPGWQAECIGAAMVVDSAFPILEYRYALVMESPEGHSDKDQPRFSVALFDERDSLLPEGSYTVTGADIGRAGFRKPAAPACGEVWYKEWTTQRADLSAFAGSRVRLRFCTADCGLGSHFAYAYLDYSFQRSEKIAGTDVRPVSMLYVPNAFTPGGDGKNDRFGPEGKDIVEYELFVFDRWGVLVFETTSLNVQWDGRAADDSSPAPGGPYLWMIRAKGSDGREYKLTGEVLLIR